MQLRHEHLFSRPPAELSSFPTLSLRPASSSMGSRLLNHKLHQPALKIFPSTTFTGSSVFREFVHFEIRRGIRDQSEARACDLGDPFGTDEWETSQLELSGIP